MERLGTDHTKHGFDLAALLVALGALAQWLPALAAALTIIWYTIRIYEWAEKRWGRDASDTGDNGGGV